MIRNTIKHKIIHAVGKEKDFRISLGPAFVFLGELFQQVHPGCPWHGLVTSSFSASSLNPLFREPLTAS